MGKKVPTSTIKDMLRRGDVSNASYHLAFRAGWNAHDKATATGKKHVAEAREWARKYKRMYEECSEILSDVLIAQQEEINEELERKYNQLTCGHLFAHSYDTHPPMLVCANCGKDLS